MYIINPVTFFSILHKIHYNHHVQLECPFAKSRVNKILFKLPELPHKLLRGRKVSFSYPKKILDFENKFGVFYSSLDEKRFVFINVNCDLKFLIIHRHFPTQSLLDITSPFFFASID